MHEMKKVYARKYTFCCGIFHRLNTLGICNWNPNPQYWNLSQKTTKIKRTFKFGIYFIWWSKNLKLYSFSVDALFLFVVQFELINIFTKNFAVDDNFINSFCKSNILHSYYNTFLYMTDLHRVHIRICISNSLL